jgi:hypothetical protein
VLRGRRDVVYGEVEAGAVRAFPSSLAGEDACAERGQVRAVRAQYRRFVVALVVVNGR